jgi:cellulose synthase/poly-beta-1,6-N-acetylglucosamine synthase-like glycosyltransferase
VNRQPVYSIIVPTRDRPHALSACLGALARLEAPGHPFEVLVVDDGSRVSPEAVVAPFRAALDATLVRQQQAGPAAARNAGAARARGRFLAFTDDDCAPAPDWLRTLAVRFRTTPDHVIGGRTVNVLVRNPYSTASQLLLSYLYGYYNADPDRARFFATMNLAVPAAGFRALGGFDASYALAAAEDRDLCRRWLECGRGMTYAPEAVVHHAHPLTLRTFWRQHFRYGRGAFRFHHARSRYASRGPRLESAAFYTNLARYPSDHAEGHRACLLVALLLLAQTANAAGYCRERMVSVLPFRG